MKHPGVYDSPVRVYKMPELPEVQTIVNDLIASDLIDKKIISARVYWPKTIDRMSPATFCRRIKGKQIRSIDRRGKFIVIKLSQQTVLLIHLRMTGRLVFEDSKHPRNKHEHVILNLADRRQLRFKDTRKFGRFYLVDNPEEVCGHLGPEPLAKEFTLRVFIERLRVRRRRIKPLLLDQSFVAGIGNIYADESLWAAGIHPERLSSSLADSEIRALHRAIPRVLKQGLKHMGTTLGRGETNFYSVAGYRGNNQERLKVFRRDGQPCPRCRKVIQRMVVEQRGTFFCPACQC
ncbi:DNA-formamidopyrimidine glycosylase [Thermodesulfobacteriota bacterium]